LNTKTTINVILAQENKNVTELAELLGQSPQNLHKKLQNDTLRYREALEIAEVLGYKIEWMHKTK
jgi:DNA-binding Xre family transcriptional regulator